MLSAIAVDGHVGLRDEVGLALQVIGPLPVDDLELALGEFEPA